jgi:hypothetical protein
VACASRWNARLTLCYEWGCTEKDDPGRAHETLGISHAYPNRLNQLYQTAMVSLRSIGWERDRLIANRRNSI